MFFQFSAFARPNSKAKIIFKERESCTEKENRRNKERAGKRCMSYVAFSRIPQLEVKTFHGNEERAIRRRIQILKRDDKNEGERRERYEIEIRNNRDLASCRHLFLLLSPSESSFYFRNPRESLREKTTLLPLIMSADGGP